MTNGQQADAPGPVASASSPRWPADAAPRLAPLSPEEVTGELGELILRMAELNASLNSREADVLTDVMSSQARDGDVTAAALARLPEIIRTMLRHPALFGRQTDLGMELLMRGVLPARDRELAILRTAWLCQAPYEWGEHVLIARSAGVDSAAVERVTIGPDADGWSTHEGAVLRAVDELRAHAMISDATWATLADGYDDAQLIELPILIGQYQAVAYLQNSLRLRLHAGNDGLAAR